MSVSSVSAVPVLPVFDQDTVLRAISPGEAIERVREGFVEYAGGEWQMPPKVYLESYPHGDFRAMPAKGSGDRDPQVGHVVPTQSGGWAAGGDGSDLRVVGCGRRTPGTG
jgi:hypothetical protein